MRKNSKYELKKREMISFIKNNMKRPNLELSQKFNCSKRTITRTKTLIKLTEKNKINCKHKNTNNKNAAKYSRDEVKLWIKEYIKSYENEYKLNNNIRKESISSFVKFVKDNYPQAHINYSSIINFCRKNNLLIRCNYRIRKGK
ncbi:hypothetical protein [Mycoplasma leonicaptivi]|uniref:hypothetical protein n=1 Tax=Mycoplasma leonicaptivi TaxID=36742 RepID=UPI0004874B26|nr:hypothetical protein [Mycoplasma leonicaptivi]